MSKMRKISKARITVLVIFIVVIFIAFFDFPQIINWVNTKAGTEIDLFKEIPFRLGLDLQGGTHLVYEADVSKIASGDRSDAVEGVRDVIERRVNAFGVSEPLVQVNKGQGKWRIIVDLAGIKDVKEAIKMIGETPLLEFKEQNDAPARELTPEEKTSLDKFNKDAKVKANKALAEALSGKDFAQVVKEYTEDDTGDTGGDIGWIGSQSDYSYLFSKAGKAEVDKVFPELIEWSDGFHVMKVNEKRDSGTEVKASHILICYKGAERCDKETTKEDAKKKIDELKAKVTPANFAQLAKENSTEPAAATTSGDLGWFGKGQMVKEFEDATFKMAKGAISDVIETSFGYHIIYKTDERPAVEYKISQLLIKTKKESDILPSKDPWKDTGLTGKQLKGSRVEFASQTTAPEVALEFNDEGKKLFADITTRNVGKPVAIFLDGKAISTPRVNEPIREGKAVITGSFDVNEAKQLSTRLNAGALPVPIELISQDTVGASLGSKSLQQSLFAGLVGFLLVMLFMIVYYRLPGVLAVLTLMVYGTIVLFVFKAIPVTLTLAGIAGFILSVGMAVDANVLIFERMKEELKLGKPLGTAIDEGFKRAWLSIRDGNITTLITCLILMFFGTSMIKGFAVTLTVGILVSLFSALVITKQLLLLLTGSGQERKLWLFGVKKTDNEIKK